MAIEQFRVSEKIPAPARSLTSVLQAHLKINQTQSERLIHDGLVRVNNRVSSQNHKQLQVGDQITVDYVPKPQFAPTKRGTTSSISTPFTILYDDEDIIVVNKAAGILTVPTPYRENNTLLGLLNRYQERQRSQQRVHCVHRLDRGVSGVLVFAKSVEIVFQLREQFAARKPERVYACLVAGQLEDKSGSIRSYLATDKDLNRYSTTEEGKGELAITHWNRRQLYSNATLVSVELETGRRNQIRVHMADLGHPILGDPRYSTEMAKHRRWPYPRIALHAESLGLKHPRTGQPLKFETDWPQEFRQFHRYMKGKASQ